MKETRIIKTYEPNSYTTNKIEDYGNIGAAEIEYTHSGPWPTMHLLCDYAQSIFSISFHVTIDILENMQVLSFYLGIADDSNIPDSVVSNAVQGAMSLILEITSQEEEKFWADVMYATWISCKLISLAKIASPWLEALFYVLLATWWYAFMMSLAFAVDHIISGNWSPLTSVLAIAGLFILYLGGGIHSWFSSGSQAWSEFSDIFNPAAVHGALDWPQGYKDCFKMRTGLAMTITQFAAVIVVLIVVAGIYFGAFG